MKIKAIKIIIFLMFCGVNFVALDHHFNSAEALNLFSLNKAHASYGEDTGNKKTRDCLTGQKLRVTSITGCVNINVSVGDILDSSAGLNACVTFEWVDCYKVDCYDGGKDVCTPYDWTVCASSGCPSFCS